MLNQPMAETATMERPLTIEDIARNPEVKKTRCSLLTVLLINMVITVLTSGIDLSLIFKDFSRTNISYGNATVTSRDSDKTEFATDIIVVIIEITYLTFYIVAVFKHNRHLILIFTWITMILLFIECCSVILSFFSVDLNLTDFFPPMNAYEIIISINTFIILPFLAVLYSFKLAKLIKTQKRQIV